MTGIIITAIICGTLIILAGIGAWSNHKQRSAGNQITDAIIKNINKKL